MDKPNSLYREDVISFESRLSIVGVVRGQAHGLLWPGGRSRRGRLPLDVVFSTVDRRDGVGKIGSLDRGAASEMISRDSRKTGSAGSVVE